MPPRVFVGRLECGCAVELMVDSDRLLMDNIEKLKGWLESGLYIERVDLDAAKAMPLGCQCESAKAA